MSRSLATSILLCTALCLPAEAKNPIDNPPAPAPRLPATHVAATNVPIDTDGNGLLDYVSVSDWDGDGALELQQDLQAAVDALDDPGPKWVHVEPGVFNPPADVGQVDCVVELPSNLTLTGSGAGITILRGFPAADVSATAAVLGNRRLSEGTHDVHIRELEVDGGGVLLDAAYASHTRMGIYLKGCTDCSVEQVTIHDTLHSCLYSKNGREVTFRDNTLRACGTHPGGRYSCIYLYADNGRTQENVHVIDNYCSGSGAPGISTRRSDSTATLRRIVLTGNTVEDTVETAGVTAECVNISGARELLLANTTCRRTGPVRVGSGADYYSSGGDARSSAELTIDGLTIDDAKASGLQVLEHLENATIRGVHVQGTGPLSSCVEFQNPLRNVEFEGLTLEDCGQAGLAQISDVASGAQPDEGLVFRDVTIARVDADRADSTPWPGAVFRGETRLLQFENVAIDDASGDGVVWLGRIVDSTVEGLDIRHVGGHGVRVAGGSSGLALRLVQATWVSGDGVRLAWDERPSGPAYDHEALTLSGATLGEIGGHGIATSDGVSLHDVGIESVSVAGAGGAGIRLALAQDPPSANVVVRGNAVRDFGRAASGSPSARAFDVSGSGERVVVRENLIVGGHAGFGIAYAPWVLPDDLAFLCTNRFQGLALDRRFWVPASSVPFDVDSDGDTHADGCDNCPASRNRAQLDSDADGAGNICDNCRRVANSDQIDTDADGPGNDCDNCDTLGNPGQSDVDSDSFGDVCDNCPDDANVSQSDLDADGTGERCDLDDGRIHLGPVDVAYVEWQDEQGVDAFNLYRGDLAVLRASGVSTQAPGSNVYASADCALTTSWAYVPQLPAPGESLFMLVSGTTGGVEGDLGTDGAGNPRPNLHPCP